MRGMEPGRKELLGGKRGELAIILLAATGIAVERHLKIGEEDHQTLELAAYSGIFTLR